MTTSRLDELVCFAIYSAANSTAQAYRQALSPWNLTYTQFLVLVVLADGARSVSALGRELGLDSGTLSPLLRRLENRGLLARERQERDERVVSVALTEEGQSTRRAVSEAVGCLVPAFIGASSDLPELIRQLQGVTHNMVQLTSDLRSA
jgi:MarR family transcriptional regulator, organic hydroperoxide resistance regulator